MKKLSKYFILLALCLFLLPMTVKAEDAILPTVDSVETTTLTIAPSVFEGVLTQGKTTSQTFELKNGSNVPLPIKSYIRNFDASDEVGGVAIPDEADARRLSPRSWIEVVLSDFIIQPQTSRQITVNFNPPKDLPPGGYYAIFFAEPLLPESFLSGSSLQIGGRIGSLLFLISPGDINEKGKIASANFPRYIFTSATPELKIRFQNEGNVHLRPSGKITVTNLITKKSREVKVPEFTVLPGKIRQQIVAVGGLKWPGVYRVNLQLNYGRDKITLDKTLTFYYLPIILIVVIITLIGLSIVLILGKTRKRVIKAVKVIIKGEK